MGTSHGRGLMDHDQPQAVTMYGFMGRAYCVYEEAETQLVRKGECLVFYTFLVIPIGCKPTIAARICIIKPQPL
jgi:hypothetical protein